VKYFKYRLNPNKTQQAKLLGTLSICRNVYNFSLEEKINLYKNNKQHINVYTQIKNIKNKNIPDIDLVYAQVIQSVIMKVDNSFKIFYTKIKKHDKCGLPRYKTIDSYNSFTYPQQGFKLIDNKHLKLSKIGTIKIKLHRPIIGIIKNLTIKRNKIGQWFACFGVDTSIDIKPIEIKNKVGIDLGCTNFAALSNDDIIENPHYYKKSQSKLFNLKKKSDITKNQLKIKRLEIKIQNQRNNFLHQLSKSIIDKYDLICIEDLDIKHMLSLNYKNLNKSILDSGWYQFSLLLSYKAEKAGKKIIKVNPAYTSQICSSCGSMVKKELKDRTHSCACGLNIDRDVNAAINILSFGMKLFETKSQ